MLNLKASLHQILSEACRVGDATRGALQVYNPELDRLQIVAQVAFEPNFIQLYQLTRLQGTSASVRAFQLGKRVIIADVSHDPFYMPYLATAVQLGIKAVQSTPILDKQQKPIGVITTNFATITRLSRAQTQVLDECAARAARLIQSGWIYQVLE